jgi:hypothetical protein
VTGIEVAVIGGETEHTSGVLRVRCFVIEHSTTHGADKERKALIPRSNQLMGKLFLYEGHIVKATDGRG